MCLMILQRLSSVARALYAVYFASDSCNSEKNSLAAMSAQCARSSETVHSQPSSSRQIASFFFKFHSLIRTFVYFCAFGILLQLFFLIPSQFKFARTHFPWFQTSQIPTVFIVSNRRSGTHLTMDLLSHIMSPPYRLVKTNHVYLTESTTPEDLKAGINCRCFNYMRKTGKIVHAYRDVRDVVISMYYYYRSYNHQGLMKGFKKDDFLKNQKGVRNKVIQTWVNTTVPWFMYDDIFQLEFSDAISGYEHIYDKIALFLGLKLRGKVPVDPRKMTSPSGAVAKMKGKGDHGYKDEMTADIANEILELARSMHNEKRRLFKSCPLSSSKQDDHRDTTLYGASKGGFWIGGSSQYGLLAPSYCPPVLATSKVLLVSRPLSYADIVANYTDVLL